MWTDAHRARYRRDSERFPSDLTDAEWVRLEPLIPDARPGGRPRNGHAGGDERDPVSASDGLPLAHLPRDGFPPRSTVYNVFRDFQRQGVWEAIWAELHADLREAGGREASPTAAVLDSQSIKSAEKGAVMMAP